MTRGCQQGGGEAFLTLGERGIFSMETCETSSTVWFFLDTGWMWCIQVPRGVV